MRHITTNRYVSHVMSFNKLHDPAKRDNTATSTNIHNCDFVQKKHKLAQNHSICPKSWYSWWLWYCIFHAVLQISQVCTGRYNTRVWNVSWSQYLGSHTTHN